MTYSSASVNGEWPSPKSQFNLRFEEDSEEFFVSIDGHKTINAYVLSVPDIIVGICISVGIWSVLIIILFELTNKWPVAVAIILGFGIVPIGISSGIRRRA